VIGPFQFLTDWGSNFKGPSIFEGEKNACESINPFWRGISANTRATFKLHNFLSKIDSVLNHRTRNAPQQIECLTQVSFDWHFRPNPASE
jgi:hypothetical protein